MLFTCVSFRSALICSVVKCDVLRTAIGSGVLGTGAFIMLFEYPSRVVSHGPGAGILTSSDLEGVAMRVLGALAA